MLEVYRLDDDLRARLVTSWIVLTLEALLAIIKLYTRRITTSNYYVVKDS